MQRGAHEQSRAERRGALAHEGALQDLDWIPLEGRIHDMLRNLYLQPIKEKVNQIRSKIPLEYVTDPINGVASFAKDRFGSLRAGLALGSPGSSRQTSGRSLRPIARATTAVIKVNKSAAVAPEPYEATPLEETPRGSQLSAAGAVSAPPGSPPQRTAHPVSAE